MLRTRLANGTSRSRVSAGLNQAISDAIPKGGLRKQGTYQALLVTPIASQTHVRTPNNTFAEDNDAFSEDEVPIILEDEDYSVSDLYFVTHPGES